MGILAFKHEKYGTHFNSYYIPFRRKIKKIKNFFKKGLTSAEIGDRITVLAQIEQL